MGRSIMGGGGKERREKASHKGRYVSQISLPEQDQFSRAQGYIFGWKARNLARNDDATVWQGWQEEEGEAHDGIPAPDHVPERSALVVGSSPTRGTPKDSSERQRVEF